MKKPYGSHSATIKSVATLLDRAPDAGQVMAHAGLVLRAGRIYEQIAPAALARVSRVANLKAGVVVLHADHGAAANKLQQQTGHLIEGFLKRGIECTGVVVRVQASPARQTMTEARVKPLGEPAVAALERASADMRDGSPLKARLQQLISRVARRTTTN